MKRFPWADKKDKIFICCDDFTGFSVGWLNTSTRARWICPKCGREYFLDTGEEYFDNTYKDGNED